MTATSWPGIHRANELLPRMLIHRTRCAELIESLENYHTKEDKTRPGHQTSTPVHDWSSHDADAFRQIPEAMEAGLVRNGWRVPKVISPI